MVVVTICPYFGAQEKKTCHCFNFSPFYLPWSGGTGCDDLSSPFSPHRETLIPLWFLLLEWYLHIWGCCYFSWQSWFQLVSHPAWHFTWCTLRRKKLNSVTDSTLPLSICHGVVGPDAMVLDFWMLNFKPAFSLTSFTFSKKLFNSSSHPDISLKLSAYLRLVFLLEYWFQLVIHPVTFHMIYSAYKLNKQGDNIQPWQTPFPILN